MNFWNASTVINNKFGPGHFVASHSYAATNVMQLQKFTLICAKPLSNKI